MPPLTKQNFHRMFPEWAMPSDEDWQRSACLEARIKATIQEKGPMPFAHFMDMALYDSERGYYAVANTKFGEQGDFTTAPNISPIFSECLANQYQQVLNIIEGGMILEVGAGNGKMACDSLLYLEQASGLPEKYLILERSAGLQTTQREYLQTHAKHLFKCVEWVTEVPAPFDGIIVCNELLDAMPVQRFQWMNGEYYQICVDWNEAQGLHEIRQAVPEGSVEALAIERLQNNLPHTLPDGYCCEINFRAVEWMTHVATCLQRGLLLILDYGYPQKEYYHPQRMDGTRVCFYRHHRHNDPLILIGLQDLSCHVDFTALTEVAVGQGLDLSGFSTQAGFLMGCGITQCLARRQKSQEKSPLSTLIEMNNNVDKLLNPSEMGELIKAIAFQKGMDEPMRGFSMQDISFKL